MHQTVLLQKGAREKGVQEKGARKKSALKIGAQNKGALCKKGACIENDFSFDTKKEITYLFVISISVVAPIYQLYSLHV